MYSSASGLLQRIRFGAPSPTADPPLDTSSLGRLTALAVNAAGGRIAFGTDAGRLYLVENGQSSALISSTIAQPSAAAFDDSGQHLYALDAKTQRIIEFNSGAGETEFTTLDGADAAVGLALSANGRYVLVTGASKTVRVYEARPKPHQHHSAGFHSVAHGAAFDGRGFPAERQNDGEYLLVLEKRNARRVLHPRGK